MIRTKLGTLNIDWITLWVILLILVAAPFADAGPLLKVSPGTFNFGEIAEGTPAMVTFVLRNSGDAELAIQSVASS